VRLQDIKLSEVTQKMAELEMRLAQELALLWALKVQATRTCSLTAAAASTLAAVAEEVQEEGCLEQGSNQHSLQRSAHVSGHTPAVWISMHCGSGCSNR
jgi:hypothetical protein